MIFLGGARQLARRKERLHDLARDNAGRRTMKRSAVAVGALKAGDRAPDFRGITTDGKEVSLADYRGRKLILYFYPMDFSPICTMQTCSLRDHNEELKAHGADILGIGAIGFVAPAFRAHPQASLSAAGRRQYGHCEGLWCFRRRTFWNGQGRNGYGRPCYVHNR
jgi:AhpC/TSA family